FWHLTPVQPDLTISIATVDTIIGSLIGSIPSGRLGRRTTLVIIATIAFFAFSQGAVIWLFISEIFPSEVRAKSQTPGGFNHWIMAVLIAFSFPTRAENRWN